MGVNVSESKLSHNVLIRTLEGKRKVEESNRETLGTSYVSAMSPWSRTRRTFFVASYTLFCLGKHSIQSIHSGLHCIEFIMDYFFLDDPKCINHKAVHLRRLARICRNGGGNLDLNTLQTFWNACRRNSRFEQAKTRRNYTSISMNFSERVCRGRENSMFHPHNNSKLRIDTSEYRL
jgi:hypothetical protein